MEDVPRFIILLFLSSIFFCTFDCKNAYPYSVQSVPNSGIYFNPIGNAKITNDVWTLITHKNISHFQRKFTIITRVIRETRSLCFDIQFKQDYHNCTQNFRLLEMKLLSLENKYDSLTHLLGHTTPDFLFRTKRGLINAGSYALKFLFGTPSSDDADYYADSIQKTLADEKNLGILMKEQIHITRDTITNFNRSMFQLQHNEQLLNHDLRTIQQILNEQVNVINKEKMKSIIIYHENFLTHLSLELDEELSDLISAILFAKRNLLHPSVLTPRILLNELNLARLPSDLEFPFPLIYSEIFKFNDICQITSFYKSDLLIISVRIPLVTSLPFHLYQVLPNPSVPFRSRNSLVYRYIEPSVKYILTSHLYQGSGTLQNLHDSCININKTNYICHINLLKTAGVCELDMLSLVENVTPTSCLVKLLSADFDIWQDLGNNRWLFTLTKPTNVTIICSNVSLRHTLQNSGIFKLEKGCKTYTTHTLLVADDIYTQNYFEILPPLDLTIHVPQFLLNKTSTIELPLIKISNSNIDDLHYLGIQLDHFEELVDENLKSKNLLNKTNFLEIFLEIIFLCLFFYFLYKIRTLLSLFFKLLLSKCLHPCYRSFPSSRQTETPDNSNFELQNVNTNNLNTISETPESTPRYNLRRSNRQICHIST